MDQAEPGRSLDPESQTWVDQLTAGGAQRDAAMVRLQRMLLQVTKSEARRRGAGFRLYGPELDDLAEQAATDATLAVCRRIATFRGESRCRRPRLTSDSWQPCCPSCSRPTRAHCGRGSKSTMRRRPACGWC